VFLAVLVLGSEVGKADVDSLGGPASGAVGTESIYKENNPKNDITFTHTTHRVSKVSSKDQAPQAKLTTKRKTDRNNRTPTAYDPQTIVRQRRMTHKQPYANGV
jgi:hypothetical protein